MPPTPQSYLDNIDSLRRDDFQRHFFMSRLHKQDGAVPKIASSEEVQARLMKTLAVECKLRKAFDGKVNALATKVESTASSLPHSIIIAVLRFLGMPEVFLDLFTCALEPKLNVKSSTNNTAEPITPNSGVFVGYGLEVLCSEAVLFILELATRKATGSYMYCLYEQCYFVGTEVYGG
ncbi:hypothetical protein G6011_03910 [Alternaria panax]|uniref:Uncharacterized protein n=1 Tax=Alternaria panax TaxID=48097 RepID=A0AAD4IFX1_9PLEO|nr:hypothetical protein G6011_03910 [Alternaria panax]